MVYFSNPSSEIPPSAGGTSAATMPYDGTASELSANFPPGGHAATGITSNQAEEEGWTASLREAAQSIFERLEISDPANKGQADEILRRVLAGRASDRSAQGCNRCFLVQRCDGSKSRYQVQAGNIRMVAQKAIYLGYHKVPSSNIGGAQIQQECLYPDGSWWCLEPTHLAKTEKKHVSPNVVKHCIPSSPHAMLPLLRKAKADQPSSANGGKKTQSKVMKSSKNSTRRKPEKNKAKNKRPSAQGAARREDDMAIRFSSDRPNSAIINRAVLPQLPIPIKNESIGKFAFGYDSSLVMPYAQFEQQSSGTGNTFRPQPAFSTNTTLFSTDPAALNSSGSHATTWYEDQITRYSAGSSLTTSTNGPVLTGAIGNTDPFLEWNNQQNIEDTAWVSRDGCTSQYQPSFQQPRHQALDAVANSDHVCSDDTSTPPDSWGYVSSEDHNSFTSDGSPSGYPGSPEDDLLELDILQVLGRS